MIEVEQKINIETSTYISQRRKSLLHRKKQKDNYHNIFKSNQAI